MAMTQKFIVSFALSVGFGTEAVLEIEKARQKVLKAIEVKGLEVLLATRPKDEGPAIREMANPETTNDQILTTAIKRGIKEAILEMRGDDKKGTFIKVGDISLKPRESVTECPRCIHDKTCIKVAQAGCKAVTE